MRATWGMPGTLSSPVWVMTGGRIGRRAWPAGPGSRRIFSEPGENPDTRGGPRAAPPLRLAAECYGWYKVKENPLTKNFAIWSLRTMFAGQYRGGLAAHPAITVFAHR
jgi:hypothetical protein